MYVLNAIITTVKAYIYAQRVAEKTDLSIAEVKAKVKDLLELEKYSFKVNGNLNKFMIDGRYLILFIERYHDSYHVCVYLYL